MFDFIQCLISSPESRDLGATQAVQRNSRAGRQFLDDAGWDASQGNTCFQFTTSAKTVWEVLLNRSVNPFSLLRASLCSLPYSFSHLPASFASSSVLFLFFRLHIFYKVAVSLLLICMLHQKDLYQCIYCCVSSIGDKERCTVDAQCTYASLINESLSIITYKIILYILYGYIDI